MKHLSYFLILLLFLLCSHPVFAKDEQLIVVDGQNQIEVSVDSLRKQADTEFTIFAPFRGRQVQMRGILLETLLEKYLSKVPRNITLTAIDGHQVSLKNWQRNHWLVVTHEDGLPLSLRQLGPLRMIERHYEGRDPKNLRSFNQWIWMLHGIQTLP